MNVLNGKLREVFEVESELILPTTSIVKPETPTPRGTLRTVFCICYLVIVFYIGLVVRPYYSADELKRLPISAISSEFAMLKHSVKEYRGPVEEFGAIPQSVRLESINKTIDEAVHVMNAVGLPWFVEGGTLLGAMRHPDRLIPWDMDADIGVDADECRRQYPDQSVLLAKLNSHVRSDRFLVQRFDCNAPHPNVCSTGTIVDTTTGFSVDVFGYNLFSPKNPSEHHAFSRSGKWLVRDCDMRDPPTNKLFPYDAAYPVRFDGKLGLTLPAQPQAMLDWDYGLVHEAPLLWYGLGFYTSPAPLLSGLVFLFALASAILVFKTRDRSNLVCAIALVASLVMLRNGILLFAVLTGLCLLGSPTHPRLQSAFRIGRILSIVVLLGLTRPLIVQAFITVVEAIGIIRASPVPVCHFHDLFCFEAPIVWTDKKFLSG